MKKTFKRAGVAVLSMAMLLSMGAMTALTSNAANYKADQNVTLNAPTTYEDAVYKVYKVASASVATSDSYHYTVLSPYNTLAAYDTDTKIESQTTDAEKKAMADAFATKASSDTPVVTLYGKSSAGATSTTLQPGYYLIVTQTTGTTMTASNILLPIYYDADEATHVATFNPKTSQPTITKEIVGTSNTKDGAYSATSVGTAKDTADVAVNEYVKYEIKVNVPKYNPTVNSITQDFTVTDDPAKGVTIENLNDVIVYNVNDSANVPATNYTITTKAAKDEKHSEGFTVVFTDDYVLANGGDTITLTYPAKINSNIKTGNVGNPNTATLSYDNDYDTAHAATPTKPTDDATVYSAKVTVVKTGDAGAALENAGFTLYSDSGCTSAVTSEIKTAIPTGKTDAVASFVGLKAGTYYLKETTVPSEYKEADVVEIVISAKGSSDANYAGNYTFTGSDKVTNTSVTINVDSEKNGSLTINNIKGKTLPGTGGMGTVLFTVGGAAIVLLAGVLFVVYMRKRKVEE